MCVPFSLGVATYNDVQDANPHMATLIQRSSILPARRTERFFTLSNNQRQVQLSIYQGGKLLRRRQSASGRTVGVRSAG